jgi:uncharacterized protein YbjT (DUF2867 family)
MSRHAFIVGGTGQIGRAVTSDLLEHGWHVTVSHRGNRPLGDFDNGLGAIFNRRGWFSCASFEKIATGHFRTFSTASVKTG